MKRSVQITHALKAHYMKKPLSSFDERGFYGAGDEARTRYLHLGKVALYRMSYTRISGVHTEHHLL